MNTMEKDHWKVKYVNLRQKYQELKKEWSKLKSHYEKLKENNEIDLGQIKFLRKENEYLKSKFKKSQRTPSKGETFNQTSIIEEQYSHYLVPQATTKVPSTGIITQAAPDQSLYSETLSPLIYQGFFIIGPNLSDIQSDSSCPATLLYEYYPPHCLIDNNMKPLIPQLCFPQEASLEKFSCKEEVISSIYPKVQHRRSQKHFVFTLRNECTSAKTTQVPNSDHELLYVICIETKDFVKVSGSLYRVPKCYCLASFVPAFELHFEVLTSLLTLRTQTRTESSGPGTSSLAPVSDTCEDSEVLLLECYADCEELLAGRTIQLGTERTGMIWYKCPEDLAVIDVCWTCLPLIASLSFRDFFWLVCALVQEKSIVFMSANLGLVTSCVLAMNCIIRPFRWPNLMVPIIPDTLHELLEAPIPMLAGCVYVSPITRHSLDSVIWVVLDEVNVEARVQSSPQIIEEVIEPKHFTGKAEMNEVYNSIGNKKMFESSAEMNEKCLRIKEIWREYWGKLIEEYLKGTEKFSDLEFAKAVIDTQMFAIST